MDMQIQPTTLLGRIHAISSKSDVHRLLIASALANGVSRVHFTTLSDDIAATVNALRAMGAEITVTGADGGFTATVHGGKTMPSGAELDANECGTTARLLLPVAAALCDRFTLTGKNGLCKRPFADLCDAMAPNGALCSDTHLPITTHGKLHNGIFTIRGDVSSQYISGLLFALPLLDGDSEIRLTTPAVSVGYIDMTLSTLRRFGITVEQRANSYFVKGNQTYTPLSDCISEGDWSNATFWLCAGAIGEKLTISGLTPDSLQKDRMVLDILEQAGARITRTETEITIERAPLHGIDFDGEDIPDALPALATVLALADGESLIRGGARLKIKESDRIATTASMLTALGANITATDDGFIIHG
ncbi:MAG: 3-phosphoshikimate 1-carboxyvinyltransferase, partial [Clostridia bacterium]|nr:3-phosphoshikimate 1-carboxyvinyltransferase [Clostridia bacterium]